MRVGIATDHGGFALKEELMARLHAAGHQIVDFGAHSLNPHDDYPDFVVLSRRPWRPARWIEAWLFAGVESASAPS
jgi:hypothetical protein